MIPDIIHQQTPAFLHRVQITMLLSIVTTRSYICSPQLHKEQKKTKCLLRESKEIARFQMRDRITALLITCGASGLKSGPPA